MLIIGVGSKNPAKLKAVERFCGPLGHQMMSVDAPSGVSSQPIGDEETMQGAVGRARTVLDRSQADIGIGLEGGVMDIGSEMYLCNWGALAVRGAETITASGARILLPHELAIGIREGRELGDVIDDYARKVNVRQGEGTIGILTNGHVSRDDMFFHIASLLFGQYEYKMKQKPGA